MSTQRRQSVLRLAEALGVTVAPGQPTGELMERCIERAESLGGAAAFMELEPDELEPEEPAQPKRAEPLVLSSPPAAGRAPRRRRSKGAEARA